MNFWFAIRFAALLLILAAALWLGLKEGLDGMRDADTSGQRIASACQVVYGAMAGFCFTGIVTRRPWIWAALIGWVVFVSITAGFAPVVWGGESWRVGVLSGLSALTLALLVAWGARSHLTAVASPNRGKTP